MAMHWIKFALPVQINYEYIILLKLFFNNQISKNNFQPKFFLYHLDEVAEMLVCV